MRFYTYIKEVKLEKQIINKAQKFAEDVIGTVNYKDSNQSNTLKIKNDHCISKIGEEAVRIVFQECFQVDGPDYTIYDGKGKSWEDDLKVNGIGLAVKTMKESMTKKYGLSWTFQYSEWRKDPILNNKDAWVCFVKCYDLDGSYDCDVFPPYQIKELIFRDPILKYLKGKKKVVYEDDLPILST